MAGYRTIRAVRGAVSVAANTADAILSATRSMVETALSANAIRPCDIVSIVFAVTHDLDAAFPARAARELGLTGVPLLDMVSPAVSGSLPRVVRMLLTCEVDVATVPGGSLHHVYLGEAARLRPDLVPGGASPQQAAGLAPAEEADAQ